MKRFTALGVLALSSACMSDSAVPESGFLIPDSNITESQLLSQSFGGTGATLRFGNAQQAQGSVQFNSATSATITVDGERSELSNFDGEGFASPAGTEALLVFTSLNGGPSTRDVLYIVTFDTPPPFLGGLRIGAFTDGNETPFGSLPTGSVVYTGAASGITASEAANGSIILDVAFADNSFDATLTGVNPTAASATYNVTDGQIINGQLSGEITGVLAQGGALNGAIYGASGDQAAGTFYIDNGSSDLIGFFSAVN